MPEQQTLKFTIRQDGYVTEEVIGATSNECVELTRQIDNKLGGVITREYKPEYFQNNNNVTLQHDQNQTQEQRTITGSTGDSPV
tara:strand:+ start:841 stop:1092 length:252 start_codon:yes stop_codon:yes gene_type:complete